MQLLSEKTIRYKTDKNISIGTSSGPRWGRFTNDLYIHGKVLVTCYQ